jgi:hypothetical protein
VAVEHVVAGKSTVHRVAPPDTNATVPVAPAGTPLSASTEAVPYATLAGVALAVNDVVSTVMMSDVVEVAPT